MEKAEGWDTSMKPSNSVRQQQKHPPPAKTTQPVCWHSQIHEAQKTSKNIEQEMETQKFHKFPGLLLPPLNFSRIQDPIAALWCQCRTLRNSFVFLFGVVLDYVRHLEVLTYISRIHTSIIYTDLYPTCLSNLVYNCNFHWKVLFCHHRTKHTSCLWPSQRHSPQLQSLAGQ